MSFWDEEAFEEGGGGGLQSFTGYIADAYFNNGDFGAASLMVKCAFEEPELYPDRDGYTMYLRTGNGNWQSNDGGETVVSETAKAFRKDSDIARFCDALKDIEGLRELAPDFNPYNAKSYKALPHFRFERIQYEKWQADRDADGNVVRKEDGKVQGSMKPAFLTVPVEILGGTAPAAPADISDLGLTDEDQAALGAAQTDDAFMKVLLERGLTANAKVMGLVSRDLKGFRAALPF